MNAKKSIRKMKEYIFAMDCGYNIYDNFLENKDYSKMKPFPDNIIPSNKNVNDNKKR